MAVSSFRRKLWWISLSLVTLAVIDLTTSQSTQAASLVLADSVNEFSGIQGQNNWYYGYYDGPFNSSDFQQMTQFNSMWFVQNGTYWTSLSNIGGHPNGVVTSGGRASVQQWAVRRWISEIDGEITLTGTLAKNSTANGNGIIGGISIDNLPIWSQFISAGDQRGVNYELKASVKKGSFVDFILDPNNSNDRSDSSRFTATIITSGSSAAVPEPTTIAGLAIATSGLLAARRRKITG